MIDQFFRTILFGKNDVKKDVNLDPWIQSVCVCVEIVFYICVLYLLYILYLYATKYWTGKLATIVFLLVILIQL